MRRYSDRSEGERLQQQFCKAIRRSGQLFLVTPSPQRAATGHRERTLFATVELPNANDIGHLSLEGGLNIASPMPVIFTFASSSGVQENDRLTYNGFRYVLLNALAQTYQGYVMGIRCVGIRVGPVEIA